jgi:5-methylcytosine-specific restriction endonuclease McrA
MSKVLDQSWTVDMEIEIRRFFTKCVVCESKDRLAVDHVKPLSKGYSAKPGNAVILCISCNSSKGFRDLSELQDDFRMKIEEANHKFEEHWNEIHPNVI